MKKLFKENNVKVVVADLSTNDQIIWKELADLGFAGLPVNLFYPATPGAEPRVLPTRLSAGDVEEAVNQVATL